MTTTVGLLGVGQMSAAFAPLLVKKGYRVIAWNRSPEPLRRIATAGVDATASPREVFAADVILSTLFDDAAVRAVILDGGLLGANDDRPRVHACCSTISPELSRELAAAHRGIHYVAAPMVGRPPAVAAGKLAWLVSGAPEAVALARPVLAASGIVHEMGATPHAAHVAKIATNFMLGAMVEGLAEASGLVAWGAGDGSTKAFVDFVAQAASPILQTYAPLFYADRKPGTPSPLAMARTAQARAIMLKDNGLAIAIAADAGESLPLGALLRDLVQRA